MIKKNLLLTGFVAILFSLTFCQEQESAMPVVEKEEKGVVLLPDPGVVSYTFRHQFEEDVPGTLDMIKEMGITNIEFSNLFGKSAPELRALLDERGMICTSYGVGYNRLLEDLENVAEEAHTLGARHIRVAWIPHDSPFDIEDARRTVSDFNTFGKQLKEKGLMFSYHNHGFEFREHEDGTFFDYIVQNTNPEYVNFQLDVFWTVWPGHDPVALLKKYPDRFRTVHLKDLKKGIEGDLTGRAPRETMVLLGQGQVDFKSLLIAAQDTNIEYFYIEDEVDDVETSVPQSYEYITSLRN